VGDVWVQGETTHHQGRDIDDDNMSARVSAIAELAQDFNVIADDAVYFDHSVESGGCCRAKKDLEKGQLLLRLPFDDCLRAASLPEATAKLADELFEHDDDKARLSLGLLLRSRAKVSTAVERYLELFPLGEFRAMLVTRPLDELEMLDGSSLKLRLIEQQQSASSEFKQVVWLAG